MKNNTLIILFFFLIIPLFGYGQELNFKRTISIDGTYLFSFLKTEEARITPFNIRYKYNDIRIRGGFNLKQSTANNKGIDFDGKLGIEFPKKYTDKWEYYYGVDLNGTYISYNDQENITKIASVIPFFGFEIFFTKEFSLAYEPKMIYSYIMYNNNNSFLNENPSENELRLTGLSQFFINFHF